MVAQAAMDSDRGYLTSDQVGTVQFWLIHGFRVHYLPLHASAVSSVENNNVELAQAAALP